MILNLSDAYRVKVANPDLELKVRMININHGYNDRILSTCRTLDEYCRYVECVRRYVKEMPVEKAVDFAVKECIRKNILSDFLKKQRAEVVAMSILEYDEEVELKKLRRTEFRFGRMKGEEIGEKRIIVCKMCKKLQKNYTVQQIAKELEEPEEEIRRLCVVAEKYAPEYNVDLICNELIDFDDDE